MSDQNPVSWPEADLSRIPFAVYCDNEVYEKEQQVIFRGPTWNYLALEAELPNPGDFLTVKVGDNVLYGKYAGTELKYDGEEYLIMKESDILAIIK